MAITIAGISCQEIVRNYGESATLQGVGSRKGYLCNWTDRFTVARGLLGFKTTTSVGGTISITAPSRHPELLNCYCTQVEFEPVGTPSQGASQLAFSQCIVWGIYGSMNFTWGAGDPYQNIDPSTQFVYARQTLDIGTEVITIPGTKLKYSGGGPLEQDYGLKLALVDMNITLYQVPYLPAQAIIPLAGAINSSTFLGVAAGYLLFNGIHNEMQVAVDGSYTQDISYSFTYRSQPWDYAYDGSSGRNNWYKVLRADGTDLVTRQSFAGIFPGEYY